MSDTSVAPVCVFGAGAVGCYLGGRLAAAGTPVTLVGRVRIGDAIRVNGLTLTDRRGYRATLAPAEVAFSTDPAASAASRPAWRGDALWAELVAQAPRAGDVRAA